MGPVGGPDPAHMVEGVGRVMGDTHADAGAGAAEGGGPVTETAARPTHRISRGQARKAADERMELRKKIMGHELAL